MQLLRILIIDDHTLIRESLKALLNMYVDFTVVGDVARGEDACRACEALTPDVIVMDVVMPGLGGAAATKRLQEQCPEVKILALSAYDDEVYVRQLLAAGASGYVLKRTAASEIAKAIRVIAEGGVYLDPFVAAKVATLSAKPQIGSEASDQLSAREREVLRFTARGYTNKEIANLFGLSIKTIETYKARLSHKLGLRTRADVVRYAMIQGWLKE